MNIGNLGEFLTPHQAQKHPHFVSLLKDLCTDKLNEDFSSKVVQEQREIFLKEFSRAKADHESTKLIVDLIWEILSDPTTDGKVRSELEESFLTSELNHSMKIAKGDGDDHLRLFGLEIKVATLGNDTRMKVQDLLREKLTEKGVALLQQLGTNVDGNQRELLMAKLNQLPNLVKDQLEKNVALKKANEEKQCSVKEQRSKCVSTLLDSLLILEELLTKHLLELQCDQYQINGQWIKIQCDALLLKIKALHLEVLCETYNKETTPALHCIAQQLSHNIDQSKDDVETSKAHLSRYESVGQDFNLLVDEYGKLREAIKQKKWTLEKLKSYCA